MTSKFRLTTLGLELAQESLSADGCPILAAWRGKYSPGFNKIVQENFEIVEQKDAEGFLLPSNVSFYSPKRLKEIGVIATGLGLPSIGFDIGHERRKPEWLDYIIRFSWYRALQEPGAIISPAYLDSEGLDLMAEMGIQQLTPMKKPDVPTIGFCGREGGKLGLAIWRVLPKRLTRWMASNFFCGTTRGIRMTCCYPLRVDSIQILEKDPRIQMNRIRRGRLGAQPTAKGQLRRQFLNNLTNNAYALCVRGTDNYSWRFYEALSLGRIPIVIDTDCVLPWEEQIPWERLILRVPSTCLTELPDRLWQWHSSFSPSEFQQLQLELRSVFERLKPANFHLELFQHILRDHH
jgi:hypothetical protein